MEGTPAFLGPVRPHDTAPLTYRDWLRQHANRAMAGDARPVRVQYMRRGVKGCGVVLDAEAREGRFDWFEIRATDGGVSGWLPGSKVRLCSGDGRCSCENEGSEAAGFGRACAAMPAASVVPPGNTGTTVGVEA